MTDELPLQLRLFVAIEIDTHVRDALEGVQSVLTKSHAHVSWIKPGNLHLSMAFIGNTGRDTVPLLAMALDAAIEGSSPFLLEVSGLGTFGGKRSPRVVWAGVNPAPELSILHERLGGRLREAGIQLEQRPFRPHLTLGRIRSSRGREDLLRAVESAASTFRAGTFRVQRLVLMQSILEPTGARYETVHVSELNQ